MGIDEPKMMKIGELVKSLLKDFPSISVSKIRYLEDQNLLNPNRDQSGYRRYSERDREQLRWILKIQRDEYLPLEIISEKLKSGDFKPKVRQHKKLFIDPEPPVNQLTEKDILRSSGINSGQFATLKECGILDSPNNNYSQDDLSILLAARDLLKNGIEPRHLKPFKRSAEQEAGLTMQIVAPQLRKIEEKEAYIKLDELAKAGKEFRQALLRKELRKNLNGQS